MDTAALEELRALRARAYGPHADIDQDPAAVRRLRELEAQSSGSTTPSPVDTGTATSSTLLPQAEASATAGPAVSPDATPRDAAPMSVGAPAAGVTAVEASTERHDDGRRPDEAAISDGAIPAATPAAGPGEAAAKRPSRRLPRPIGVLWALSVVAAAAAASGVTYWATSMAPVSVSSGAPQIAALEPGPLAEVPPGWFGAGPSSRAWEFFGLTLFETSHGFNTPGTSCFMMVPTEQLPAEDADPNNWSMSGAVYSGCRVGDFPAMVQVAVDSGMPDAVRDRFPPGSALQFVLDGDRIGVFLDSP